MRRASGRMERRARSSAAPGLARACARLVARAAAASPRRPAVQAASGRMGPPASSFAVAARVRARARLAQSNVAGSPRRRAARPVSGRAERRVLSCAAGALAPACARPARRSALVIKCRPAAPRVYWALLRRARGARFASGRHALRSSWSREGSSPPPKVCSSVESSPPYRTR